MRSKGIFAFKYVYEILHKKYTLFAKYMFIRHLST